MGMENFSSAFQTPEQYIIDITYQIWEERGIGRIYDWYAAKCPVRSPHGVTNSVEDVVQHTLETMHVFPNREILAEDVIIGAKPSGFYSSHRARSTATHLGDGPYGQPTHRQITTFGIADCLCRDNQVVGEWLLRDHAGVALQLGLDPVAHGQAMGRQNPAGYTLGNEEMRRRWSDPAGLEIVGDQEIAARMLDTFETMWNRKNLAVMDDRYDRAVRFEGPGAHICYGRPRTGNVYTRMMSSIPDGRFEAHHLIVRQDPERPIRVAMRWSFCGTHSGLGRYGEPSGVPLAVLGISQFELYGGRIAREWMVVDETAVHAQIAAYQI